MVSYMHVGNHYSPYASFTVPVVNLDVEGDQFKVNMCEKKLISNIDIEMYFTLLGNI